MSAAGTAPVAALQEVLAAEHAAVYVYGVLGARSVQFSPAQSTLATRLAVHADRRDRLTALVQEQGGDAVGPRSAYVVAPTGAPRAIAEAAAGVESRCCGFYTWLVAQTSERTRALALGWLTESGVAVVRLGGDPQPLPGIARG